MSDELIPKPDDNSNTSDDSENPARDVDSSTRRIIFTPPIDIYETEEGLVLHADLPGVAPNTLELQVQNNKLTLFGRVASGHPEGGTPLHQEYEVGDFLRSFILSDEVDHERIKASLTHGVLKVTLPKATKEKPRRIQVSME